MACEFNNDFFLMIYLLNILFYLIAAGCRQKLGMQNSRIPNSYITSSSRFDNNHGPDRARLHLPRQGSRMGAWSARYNNYYQWIQVDFHRAVEVTQIQTQGRQDADQWVTRYRVFFSADNVHWAIYKHNSQPKVIY